MKLLDVKPLLCHSGIWRQWVHRQTHISGLQDFQLETEQKPVPPGVNEHLHLALRCLPSGAAHGDRADPVTLPKPFVTTSPSFRLLHRQLSGLFAPNTSLQVAITVIYRSHRVTLREIKSHCRLDAMHLRVPVQLDGRGLLSLPILLAEFREQIFNQSR